MKRTFIYKILQTAIAFSLLYACQQDEIIRHDNDTNGLKINLSGEINQVAITRVNDDGFCDKDEMGVYIVDYEGGEPGKLQLNGNRATNLKHTFDEAAHKWVAAYDVYWKDNQTPVDIYGYYPLGNPESIEAYAFEVQKDQSKEAVNGMMGGYEASDFLWGKAPKVAPTELVVKIAFHHKMSSARITLVEGEGFTEGEWANLQKQMVISNTKRNAAINLETGSVTAIGETSTTGIVPYKKGDEYRAIVVPQTIKAGTKLFNISVGTVPYTFSKTEDFTYVPSKMHNFSIKVDKKAHDGTYVFTLISESITAWENDPISHNATAKEYIVIDSKAGQLKECITAAKKDFRKVQNLKITGEINAIDFYFMRDSMDKLQALNLKEVIIKGYNQMVGDGWSTAICKDDQIPHFAFGYRGRNNQTLTRLVLPDKLTSIGIRAFFGCKYLSGSLIIPEGVTEIQQGAFTGCKSLTGVLSLPSTLKYIGNSGHDTDHEISGSDIDYSCGVFSGCGFTCELIIPDGVELIRGFAFDNCKGFYGNLKLPSNLKRIGERAFFLCKNLNGSLEIPQGVTDIPAEAFTGCGFDGTLTLHDGIISIGNNSFGECHFKGEINLPKNLTIINDNVFNACDFSGELKLPQSLTTIGENAFKNNWRLMGVLEIPEDVQTIGAGAFANCRSLEGIIFPTGLENIRWESNFGDEGGAFSNCFGIGSIVCKGTIPPYVQSGAFNGVAKDNFTLEVPESAIQQYQAAVGWSDFKRIAAHRELVCRPAIANAINTQCTRKLVLNAEGDWEVINKPEWCSLSAMNGSKKTELTLTIHSMPQGSPMREGDIVFALKGKDYTSKCHITQYDYEYDEDEIITLQSHSKGQGVNLVFIGDGYDAKDVSEGLYLRDMKEQVEHFFNIEPYRTYRNYFNIYTAIAVSPESGIGTINTIRYAKFETTFTGGVGLKCDYDAVFQYALKMPTVNKGNLNQSLIIVTPNTSDYGGICQMWEDGSAIAFCPKSTYGYPLDTRGVIQHEAGGHGFGKLADEYIYHNEFIDFCPCTCCEHVVAVKGGHALGWYQNISLTGKMHEVPWSHLIFDERYSNYVDIFEGGFMHNRGVFRSEQNSCMNNDIPYYSAISREAIVKRIMEYAGEPYSFEEFVKNDKVDSSISTRSSEEYRGISAHSNSHEPVIHKGKPDILK